MENVVFYYQATEGRFPTKSSSMYLLIFLKEVCCLVSCSHFSLLLKTYIAGKLSSYCALFILHRCLKSFSFPHFSKVVWTIWQMDILNFYTWWSEGSSRYTVASTFYTITRTPCFQIISEIGRTLSTSKHNNNL